MANKSRLTKYIMSNATKMSRSNYMGEYHEGPWFYSKLYIWGNDNQSYMMSKLFEGRTQLEARHRAFVFMAEASIKHPQWIFYKITNMQIKSRKVGIRHYMTQFLPGGPNA